MLKEFLGLASDTFVSELATTVAVQGAQLGLLNDIVKWSTPAVAATALAAVWWQRREFTRLNQVEKGLNQLEERIDSLEKVSQKLDFLEGIGTDNAQRLDALSDQMAELIALQKAAISTQK